jgi:hypothetical protein
MARLLLPLLLISAGCGLFQSELVTDQIPALVEALQEDAEVRKEATHSLKKVLDWLDYILAGTAAGLIALVFTASKTARRYLQGKFRKRRKR